MVRRFPTAFTLALLAKPALDARAQDLAPNALHLDLGAGLSLRAGDDRDHFGFVVAGEYERRVHRYLGVGGRVVYGLFPYDTYVYDGPGHADYLALGPSVRAHLLPDAGWGDLWLGGSAQLVVTGSLARFGLEAGAGVDFTLPHRLGVGPFVRYQQILQPDDAQRGGADGRILLFGASLSWGWGERATEPEPAIVAEPEPEPTPEEPSAEPEPLPSELGEAEPEPSSDRCAATPRPTDCPPMEPDLDGDGIADLDDACPALPGVRDSGGCPVVVTTGDRDQDGFPDDVDRCPDQPAGSSIDGCTPPETRALDVTLRFETNRATLTAEAMDDLRDALSRLRSEPALRVVIEGHSDHLGEQDHNAELSLARARSVRDWLVRHGIARSRLEVRGVGSHVPLVTGGSPTELAPNRRVELHRLD